MMTEEEAANLPDDHVITITVGELRKQLEEQLKESLERIRTSIDESMRTLRTMRPGVDDPGAIPAYITRDGGETYIRNPALKVGAA